MIRVQMRFELPDGGEMDLPMEYMEVKDCLFVPTIHPDDVQVKLYKIAQQLEFTITTRTVIYDGYLGVRFWRTN